ERAYLVFDESGEPSHIDGIVTDVTASVSAELAREVAEHSLRIRDRALASCDEGVLIAELTADRIERLVYANDAFLALSGLTREDLMDKDWRVIEVDERDNKSLKELRGIIRSRGHGRRRMRLKHKDGCSRWVEISV
ncbi:PAS domain S-box protein, partial [Arthrospira platensis SPKY2]